MGDNVEDCCATYNADTGNNVCSAVDGTTGTYQTLDECKMKGLLSGWNWICPLQGTSCRFADWRTEKLPPQRNSSLYDSKASCDKACNKPMQFTCDHGLCKYSPDGEFSSQEACEEKCPGTWNCSSLLGTCMHENGKGDGSDVSQADCISKGVAGNTKCTGSSVIWKCSHGMCLPQERASHTTYDSAFATKEDCDKDCVAAPYSA